MIKLPDNIKNEGFKKLIETINDILTTDIDKEEYSHWENARLQIIFDTISKYDKEGYDFINFYSRSLAGDIQSLIDMDDYECALDAAPDFLEELNSQVISMAKEDDWEAINKRAIEVNNGDIDVQDLISGYCYLLHRRYGTFEEVARRTNLDRRTVKKYVEEWKCRKEDKNHILQKS